MTETQVGFLYKAASSLQRAGDNRSLTLLRSYYLMRCKNITKGFGLPEKHFSSKVRCSKCCVEWSKGTETMVKALKLSKKQRQRIRLQNNKKHSREVKEKKQLLNSNEIIQVCSFCNQSTSTTAIKPEKIKLPKMNKKEIQPTNKVNIQNNLSCTTPKQNDPKPATSKKIEIKRSKVNKTKEINVYSVTKDIFSLSNKKNVIVDARKEEKKVIKNNKKKKDKFAGLCEKAVLATAKIKEQKDKQNKLNLFLKPST